MLCVVQKSFGGPTGRLDRGEIVDASTWRNTTLLIDQRYLRIATPAELASAVEVDVEDEEVEDDDLIAEDEEDDDEDETERLPKPGEKLPGPAYRKKGTVGGTPRRPGVAASAFSARAVPVAHKPLKAVKRKGART